MNVQSEAVCSRSAVTEPSRQRPATDYCLSPGTTWPDEAEEGLVSHCTTCLHLVKTRTMKLESVGQILGISSIVLLIFGREAT